MASPNCFLVWKLGVQAPKMAKKRLGFPLELWWNMSSFLLCVTVVINKRGILILNPLAKISVVQTWHGLCLAWCYHVYFDWPKVMLLEKLLQAFSKFILTWPFLGLDFTWLSTGVSSHQELTDMVKGDLRLSWDNWGDEHQGEKNMWTYSGCAGKPSKCFLAYPTKTQTVHGVAYWLQLDFRIVFF